MDLSQFHGIDWDAEDDPDGNLAHCRRPKHLGPYAERIVDEVLSEEPVEVKFRVTTAEFAIVGPDRSRNVLWLVLFDVSWRRGDFLRPVTGWRAEDAEGRQWENQRGKLGP